MSDYRYPASRPRLHVIGNEDKGGCPQNSNPFLSAYKSYGMNGIDSLVVGHFGEVNEGFKQLICSLVKVAADSQEAGKITPASSIDHKRKDAYALFKKRFKVALGCIAIRTQTELMLVGYNL